MLVQSTPDLIELLPAVPKAWSSGKVSGFKGSGWFRNLHAMGGRPSKKCEDKI